MQNVEEKLNKMLVIVAHYDDELFSCGGTIYQKVTEDNWEVDVVAITHKGDVWERKWARVCAELGVTNKIALHFPLWTDSTKEYLSPIEEKALLFALNEKVNLTDYALILTHGKDGDIDEHYHHKQVHSIIAKVYEEELAFFGVGILFFVAFPRQGVGENHRFYKRIKEREWWVPLIKKRMLPLELIDKATQFFELGKETVKLKEACKDIYFPNRDTYPCVHYPMELFYGG